MELSTSVDGPARLIPCLALHQLKSRFQESAVDIMMVDAGGEDNESGMSCPPHGFVSDAFLSDAHKCLTETGLLVINFVARSVRAYKTAMETVKMHFPFVYTVDVVEDVNRVAFASKMALDVTSFQKTEAQQRTWSPQWSPENMLQSLSLEQH